ncbi:hypothetical protein A2303_06005 [Candidatus Falkowbacteria bacterium RIFOXYB2_FULL_47_14]|uniref:Peptidase S8/S53 domain-containing protein n=1 Tax=Candidatus Falkowbacteria bacterium RIFOXYA2_FULL_47_19 TaxID=1797994 RepID=A0A1F5SME3_9BACT|nr:MAG: hypothetical protein A2227_04655 [Candidatus Falkowbacteria bacterium RIFOXYA2_FULL_47_19]OGF42772.1 MAG: hypothetical protein A2303_06005 [Candidatus Falkowbacteria bacterium RIFOXYB2_FULL_47_14]
MRLIITSFLFSARYYGLIFLFIFPAIAFASDGGYDNGTIRRKDEILVKYRGDDEIYAIKITAGSDLDSILEKYNSLPSVEYAEPNYLYNASIVPSDSYYANQWYLKKIQAPEAWNIIRESAKTIIAIIDSGVQLNHPDLADNIWSNTGEIIGNGIDDDRNGFIDDAHGWDFVNNVADPEPKFIDGWTEEGVSHGTIVAGVAAASGNNATGITGVTWSIGIMPLKALNDRGEGDTKNVIRAIDYAIANGADIINFSFAGSGFSRSLETAIRRAHKAGIIMIAAAGNEGNQTIASEIAAGKTGEGYFLDQSPMYPVCHDGSDNMVIGVAATDTLDQKAKFSGYGFKCVDISAPGVSIFSTAFYSPEHSSSGRSFDKHYDGYWSGTSMAVPMVSAAVALVETANPALSKAEVINILLDSSDNINRLNPGYLGQLGRGRLNINEAVAKAHALKTRQLNRIIAAPHGNYKSLIKIFGQSGQKDAEFTVYNEGFRGGVNVASGDVDGDGHDEIITGAGAGGGPHVKIFDSDGNLKGQFFAYREGFRGGVNVASGDVDGDGHDEIITGAGAGGGPQVRIFRAHGEIEGQFFAYDENFRGGVRVATIGAGNGTRRSKEDIITAPGAGGGPQIKVFDNHARILAQFFAFNQKFKGGVSIAAIDINLDGTDDIITGAGSGGTPHIRVFSKRGIILGSFFGFEEGFGEGVNVGTVSIKNTR